MRNYLAVRELPASEQAVLVRLWKQCDERTPRAVIVQVLRGIEGGERVRAFAERVAGLVEAGT